MLKMWRIFSVLLLASLSLGNGEVPKNAPQGDTKIKTNVPVKSKTDSDSQQNNSPPVAAPAPIPSDSNSIHENQREMEKGTEFFLLLGYRFKITDVLLVLFTGLLWWSTQKLWKETKHSSSISEKSANAALLTAQNMQITERAYVKMSHTDPGLVPIKGETTESYKVEVKIENCGKTPALVTEVRLRFMLRDWDESLPPTIDYPDSDSAERPSSAFLVPGDYFFVTRNSHNDKHRVVSKDSKRLLLFGYIDYTDVFGQQHRAGYAREYMTVKGNNLFLVAAKGYNYDRPRKETDRQDQDAIES
ncbi:MAG: hypothetical protein JSR29_13275 [Nitrospira sp.]|nr:hypothetical protein [Nitrospira sp.]